MGTETTQRYCPRCDDLVLAQRPTPNHILHLLLTFCTGVWALVWLAMSLKSGLEPARCPKCGSATQRVPWFRPVPPPQLRGPMPAVAYQQPPQRAVRWQSTPLICLEIAVVAVAVYAVVSLLARTFYR